MRGLGYARALFPTIFPIIFRRDSNTLARPIQCFTSYPFAIFRMPYSGRQFADIPCFLGDPCRHASDYTANELPGFIQGRVNTFSLETRPLMKNITIRQLKTFESVARNLSFSRAAEDLHLTQPAVSMQIKQMEDQAGVSLFSHAGRRISLTEAGQLLLRHSRVILADLKAAEQSLATLRIGGGEQMRVGLITSGSYFFPHLIGAFMQGETGFELNMTVRSRDQLIALLRNDGIDLAILVHAPEDTAIVADAFAPNPFVLVASPVHPLAGAHDIPSERIAGECLLVREAGTDTRSAADDAFRGQPFAPRFMEIGCAEAIKQSVMAGMGIGCLPVQTVQSELRAGLLAILDVQGFPLRRCWRVVHRADRHLPPAALRFRQFLLAEGGARLAHFTGIDKLHTGMDRQRQPLAAPSARPMVAGSAGLEVALRTRALLRDDGLPDQHRVQDHDHAGGEAGGNQQPAARHESTHH
ncbi:LysR family transcriptional regulator [Burkholderia glumae]|nr:LysR family transcriptional regulator [Burkholderia glumae]PJO23727.1 LysR family transcriptional regulator [Burkholderia glumae AU6208]PNL02333.1 LysR family transcriptional regulator [Burkholderia glumae]QPQ94265.1 LysR family transcriptional regulator [Burkholderia glumae]QQM90534.1 LysR family transcriptional regulator [Burkholderia glumae]UVS89514.1 LysR family transcriptional regulator [Burkholderia glumae]